MAGETIKITGLRELSDALGELGKSTERSLLRRLAFRALEPVRDRAKQLVPVKKGKLRESIVIGTNLTKRAKAADKKEPRRGVRVFVGTAKRNAVAVEFGTFRIGAQAYMRPAWDSQQNRVLDFVTSELRGEIEKTAARAAKRKARA